MARRNRPSGNWAATSGGRGWKYRRYAGTRLTAAQRRLIGSFSVLLVGLLLGYFFYILSFGKAPKFQFIAVGISAYDNDRLPPSSGVNRDLDAIRGLKADFPFAISTWEDRSKADALLPQLSNLKMNGGTLLFYLSSLAITDEVEPHLKLLLQGAAPEGRAECISFSDLLDGLKRTGAQRVVLLLDLNRIPPDSRLGIFSHRIPEYVKLELESHAKAEGSAAWIDVVCARRNHQASALDAQSPARASIFIEQIVRALEGDADGWQPDGKLGSKDLRIQYREFQGYVERTVPARAKVLSAGDQEVDWISQRSDDPSDEYVIAALKPPQLLTKPASPPAEEKAPPAEAKQAPAQETVAEAAKEGTPKEAAPNAVPAAAAEPLSPDLSSVWKDKDKLLAELRQRAEIDPAILSEVSRLLWELKRAAEFDAAGLEEQTKLKVDEARRRIDSLSKHLTPAHLKPQPAGGPQSWLQLPVITITGEQRQKFQEILAADAPQVPDSPEFVEFLSERAAEQKDVGDGQNELKTLTALAKRAQQVDKSSPEKLPFEVRFLARIHPAVLASPDGRSRVVQIVKLHRELREFLRKHQSRLPRVEAELSACFRSLDCAERWFIGAALDGLPEADGAIKTAEGSLRRAMGRVAQIDDAYRTVLRTWIELPFWIRLVAVEAEASTEESNGELVDLAQLGARPGAGGPFPAQLELSWKPGAEVQRTVSELIEIALELAPAIDRPLAGLVDNDLLIQRAGEASSRLQVLIGDDLGNLAKSHLLNLSQPSLTDRRRMEAWSTCPLISDEERVQFQQSLTQGVKSPPRPPGSDHRGLWQGYWAIQLLRLGCLPGQVSQLTPLWDQWIAWCRAVTANEPDRVLALRDAQLGKLVRSQWEQLEPTLQSSLVVPFDVRPLSKPRDEPTAVEYRPPLLAEVRARGRQPLTVEDRNYSRKLLAILQPDERPAESDFKFSAEKLVLNGDQEGDLHVTVENSAALGAGRLRLWWHAPELTVVGSDGRKSDSIELTEGQPVRVRLAAKKKTAALPPAITVAAVIADRFPYAFREVPVERALEIAAWQIRFVRSESGREIYQERRPQSDTTLFYLPPEWPLPGAPPGGEGFLCQLVRPKTDQEQEIGVRIYRRTPNGREAKPLFETEKFKIPPGDSPVTVPLAVPAPAAVPPPNGEKPALPAIDVTSGLEFELTLKDGTSIRRALIPAYWSALAYLEEPKLELTPDRLSVWVTRPLKPPREGFECFWPDQIAVRLLLPRDMHQAAAKQSIGGDEAPLLKGKTQELWLELRPEERKQFENREFEIALKVAGIPHAFSWRRAWGASDPLPFPTLRIAELPFDRALLPTEKQPFEMQMLINEPNIDQRTGKDDDWRLQCEWQTDDQQSDWVPFRGSPWKLSGSYRRSVQFQPTPDGQFQLKVETRDFVATGLPKDLNARIRMRAWLSRNGQPDGVTAERRLAVTDGRLPAVRWKDPPLEYEVRENGKPLKLDMIHSDSVAGIRQVRLGIDKDGNDKLDPATEVLSERNWEIFDDETLEWHENDTSEWKISPKDLLDLPLDKEYRFLCVATNGAGTVSEPSAVKIRLKSPPKPVVPMVTTGKLMIKFNFKGKKTVFLSGPKSDEKTTMENSLLFDELPPGSYKVKVSGYNVKKEVEATVEVKKTANVSVP